MLLGAVAVIFALQNISVITVTFFSWQLTSSLAVVLILAITVGVLVSLLILLPGSIKNSFKIAGLKKDNKKLEEELRKQKELTVFAKHEAATEKTIENIEHGAISDVHQG